MQDVCTLPPYPCLAQHHVYEAGQLSSYADGAYLKSLYAEIARHKANTQHLLFQITSSPLLKAGQIRTTTYAAYVNTIINYAPQNSSAIASAFR